MAQSEPAGGHHVGAKDFLNPNSMLTPGLAGGMVMLITNAICQHFPVEPAQIGLGVSFMFGLLVLARTAAWWMRIVYYVLNSLVIFCVAAGATGFGAAVARAPAEARTTVASAAPPAGAAEAERARIEAMIRDLQGQLGQTRSAGAIRPAPSAPAPAEPPFFRSWF